MSMRCFPSPVPATVSVYGNPTRITVITVAPREIFDDDLFSLRKCYDTITVKKNTHAQYEMRLVKRSDSILWCVSERFFLAFEYAVLDKFVSNTQRTCILNFRSNLLCSPKNTFHSRSSSRNADELNPRQDQTKRYLHRTILQINKFSTTMAVWSNTVTVSIFQLQFLWK